MDLHTAITKAFNYYVEGNDDKAGFIDDLCIYLKNACSEEDLEDAAFDIISELEEAAELDAEEEEA